jgi:hypothetical protein
MSPAVLPDLPTEVLHTICAEFCDHCRHGSGLGGDTRISTTCSSLPSITRKLHDTRALISLSRACHRLYQIVTPFIYHDFDLFCMKKRQIKAFVRTIRKRPDLRAFVCRAASFYSDMLLSTIVDVTQLHLKIDGQIKPRRFLSPSTTLRSLRALTLVWRTDYIDVLGLAAATSLLEKAPSLELLQLCNCYMAPKGLPLENLKWLRLHDSLFGFEELRDLAEACSNLETFIFHTSIDDGDILPLDYGESIPEELQRGLLPCRDTLRHLEIQCGWATCGTYLQNRVITSLKEFTVLETLILDSSCICCREDDGLDGSSQINGESSADVNLFLNLLPVSIISVTINDSHPILYEPILALAQEVRNGTFPRLKEFRENRSGSNPSFHPLGPLQNAMTKGGVSFLSS